MAAPLAIRFGRRKLRTHAPTGKPSVETCPPGQRWPWCPSCERYGATIGTDLHGRVLQAFISPERAAQLGWSHVRVACPSCGRVKLGKRCPHPEEGNQE